MNRNKALTLAALGVVFGDIGTSPLYALREAFHGSHSTGVNPDNIMGVLSLVVWALILVISIKYLLFVLRADNRGEGGVLALTALVAPDKGPSASVWSRNLLYLGLFGSALLFGDGVITPAISVLSAVEGLTIVTPLFAPYVIPITVMILALLFFSQHYGTARIGSVFGPVILFWFLVLGALGIYRIIEEPRVLEAVNPQYAFEFFQNNGWSGFFILGAVFLVVTGGEAMYADMGHFGKGPIRKAWFFVALPGLLLNYFGQGALLLTSPESADSPFFKLAPSWALLPLVGLATMATVIASQALISGVYSLAQQAVHLGYAPRMKVVHTSHDEMGQIYIPFINWTLFVLTVLLVVEFGSSNALASAYGMAVAMTMTITTFLACVVAAQKWNWKWPSVAAAALLFLLVDLLFLSANFSKIWDGGWVPLAMGTVVFTLMTTWKRGRKVLAQRLRDKAISLEEFLKQILIHPPLRIPGIALFMTSDPWGTPPALLHNVRHNKCIHDRTILLTVATRPVPHIAADKRVEVSTPSSGFVRILAFYGFMETPDIKEILQACKSHGLHFNMKDVTFFLGRETILPSSWPGMALWREKLFALMSRNAERATAYFNIPPEQVVEVGIQVEI